MNRRDFLASAAGAELATVMPLETNANATTGDATIPATANSFLPSNTVFKNRLVTILGSSKPETCEEYVGRFFSSRPDASIYPTFSFGDAYFTDVLRAARPVDNTVLISFVGDAADRSKHDEDMKQHMKSALRYDPDLFIFERLAGTNPTVSPYDLQGLVMMHRCVAGSVRAATPEDLFTLVSDTYDEEILYLTRGQPKIQVFHDMVDVTESFLKWSTDRSVTA
ncbi:hypothetical protein [Rhizobium sp. MHM7A]|uniref:hypothetical protein n=1 Tax=Rhizobium sp. MHM7A TaxID=2583233 RepID=UPI0011066DEB|nr:hypothetical protein [Rhizobium sp. MHM7A]TLX16692.1 hypothetical protein FFR93_04945 [Rhizobium sp. MHM7A]